MAKQNGNSNDPQQQYDILQNFDQMSSDLRWNNNNNRNKFIKEFELMDEQNLSQKMSQFSTSTSKNKQSLLNDIKVEIVKIPNYLTNQNKSFKQILYQALSTSKITTEDNDNMEELRKIAILIYKIMIIQTYQLLWAAYLKSGMGQLIIQSQKQLAIYPTDIPIWPKEIKIIIELSKDMNKTNENESCLKFVNDHLNELDYQLKQYQMELNIKANSFQRYTLTIQKFIETYIEQNLHSLRMEIEHQVELIHYDYHIQALKLEYLRHEPNKYQEELMKQVCQSKYEQETSEQEYQFLKQQIAYYNLPSQSFECSSLVQSLIIDSIQRATIRQELFKQFEEIAEQSRVALFNVYVQSAEDQQEEYKKKYDVDKQKIYSSKNSFTENEKISSIMIHLINERCNKIGERIECIYKFKTQSILMKS